MLAIAYSIFLANFLFGVLVKRGVVDNRRLRLVHHGLYFLVVASLAIAAVVAAVGGRAGLVWTLIAMEALLLGMALFRGRSRGHWIYATACAIVYSAIVLRN